MSKNYDTRDLEIRLNELESEFTTWKDQLTPEQLSRIKDKYETPDDEETSDEEFTWEWEDEVVSVKPTIGGYRQMAKHSPRKIIFLTQKLRNIVYTSTCSWRKIN